MLTLSSTNIVILGNWNVA